MSDDITESAKAVQEVAKTASDLIKASEKAGGFVARLIRGPAEQVALIVEDRLKFYRADQWLRLAKRLRHQVNASGGGFRVKPLPLSFAVDALEQGIMEESDDLQDLWARLIANAADASADVEPRHSFISMLKDFTPFDALVFDKIYGLECPPGNYVYTSQLPDAVMVYPHVGDHGITEPSAAVKASISNLDRLGLLDMGRTMKSAEMHMAVHKTFAGHQFWLATKARTAAQ